MDYDEENPKLVALIKIYYRTDDFFSNQLSKEDLIRMTGLDIVAIHRVNLNRKWGVPTLQAKILKILLREDRIMPLHEILEALGYNRRDYETWRKYSKIAHSELKRLEEKRLISKTLGTSRQPGSIMTQNTTYAKILPSAKEKAERIIRSFVTEENAG